MSMLPRGRGRGAIAGKVPAIGADAPARARARLCFERPNRWTQRCSRAGEGVAAEIEAPRFQGAMLPRGRGRGAEINLGEFSHVDAPARARARLCFERPNRWTQRCSRAGEGVANPSLDRLR
jgi:hypothetical protein